MSLINDSKQPLEFTKYCGPRLVQLKVIECIKEDSDNEELTSKMCEVLNLEADSWSDEESPAEDLTEDEAELYYQKLLESEYEWEYGIADLNGIWHPSSY